MPIHSNLFEISARILFFELKQKTLATILGVKVRNMKIDFNTGSTWHHSWSMNTNDENNDFFIRISCYQAIN